jgi:hypothetical protein
MAQSQETGFGTAVVRKSIKLRAAYRAEQHGAGS